MNFKNILLLPFIFLVGCELDYKDKDKVSTSTPTVASFELLDPNAAASNEFGSTTVTLANGNIVVASPFDDTVASNAGAVHLYNPFTKTVIASFYGDDADDNIGLLYQGMSGSKFGIIALANNNFVIASANDDVNSVSNAGSVMLVNGATGAQIGTTLAGNTANDKLGMSSVTALGNNNFVIASMYDDDGASVTDAGSVMLINGATGVQIGTTLAGNAAYDQLGQSSVTALGNNNFVIASRFDDDGTVSPSVVNAGSVMLINGATGVQIGTTLVGNRENDCLGMSSVTALGNNNFVIASSSDDDGTTTVDAGSVMLINGATGVQIGTTLVGDTAYDILGSSSVTALGNNNFVIASAYDDDGGGDAGSVMLINGATGALIRTHVGDTVLDNLGGTSVTALGNNNFVIASANDDVNSVSNAGSVMLVNGATGAHIGTTLAGDTAQDKLGGSSVTALGNNNFVIASMNDDVNSVTDAGSVMLINGATGVQIGTTLAGNTANDKLGMSSVTALGNNNFVIASRDDDVNGVTNAGSIRQIDTTGTQVSIIAGAATNDMNSISVTNASAHNFYVVSLSKFDNYSLTDSGFATVVAY
jgi:predicted alpha/beta hydrolase family esterase